MAKAPITHVFFDVDGVLLNGWHADEAHRIRWDITLQADLGISPQDLQEKFFKPHWNNIIVGKEDILPALTESLATLAPTVTPRQLMDYWFEKDARINPEMAELVDSLRGKYQLYIATNQEHHRAAYIKNLFHHGETFADIFYSARLGVKKENPEFFHRVCTTLNLRPENALLIDDTPAVIASAAEAGLQTLRFADPANFTDLKKMLAA